MRQHTLCFYTFLPWKGLGWLLLSEFGDCFLVSTGPRQSKAFEEEYEKGRAASTQKCQKMASPILPWPLGVWGCVLVLDKWMEITNTLWLLVGKRERT